MNKKIATIIIFVCSIIFLIYLIIPFFDNDSKNNINEESKESKVINNIKKSIENKENMNLFIYNSNSQKCSFCLEVKDQFDYLVKMYNIEFELIDTNTFSEKDIKILHELLMTDRFINSRTNLFYIRNGVVTGDFGELIDNTIVESLYRNKLIDEKYYEEEVNSQNVKLYDIKSRFGKTYLFIQDGVKNINDIKLFIKKSYPDIKAVYMEPSLVINESTRRELREELGEKYSASMVILFENGKIIDSINKIDNNSINEFIDKNK